jgi:hypothetical protein
MLTSALRSVRDDVAEHLPSTGAFSSRREHLGSEPLKELFHQFVRAMATAETPGAFWKGIRLMALDGTRESVPDTDATWVAFQYSTDHQENHSPYPQACVLLLVECGTPVICDAHIGSVRDRESSLARNVLARFNWRDSLVMWDSGLHATRAIFHVSNAGAISWDPCIAMC